MKARRPKGEADDINREMWQLCTDQNWDAIQQRLAKGEWDPNRPLVLALQPGGFLLLSAAVEQRQVALAKQLIELGADVDGRMRGESTPLTEACAAGNVEMVDLLLQAGADVNAKCPVDDEGDPGHTPLMLAAARQDREMIEKLLQYGGRIDATTRRGRTALSMVLENGRRADPGLVRFLSAAGCPVDGRDLHHPVLHRHLELVKLLLAEKPDVNKRFDWPRYSGALEVQKHDTPLFVAVAYNVVVMESEPNLRERLAIIDLLLEAGADVNEQRGGKLTGITPLMLAVVQDEEEVANRLLRAGADPHKEVSCTRSIKVGEEWQVRKSPVSAIGLAQERPDAKNVRKILLGSGL